VESVRKAFLTSQKTSQEHSTAQNFLARHPEISHFCPVSLRSWLHCSNKFHQLDGEKTENPFRPENTDEHCCATEARQEGRTGTLILHISMHLNIS